LLRNVLFNFLVFSLGAFQLRNRRFSFKKGQLSELTPDGKTSGKYFEKLESQNIISCLKSIHAKF